MDNKNISNKSDKSEGFKEGSVIKTTKPKIVENSYIFKPGKVIYSYGK